METSGRNAAICDNLPLAAVRVSLHEGVFVENALLRQLRPDQLLLDALVFLLPPLLQQDEPFELRFLVNLGFDVLLVESLILLYFLLNYMI